MTHDKLLLDRFAGIGDTERLGLGVEDNAQRLHRFAYLERCCFFVMAAHLPSIPEWEVKIALARHLYEDAEHHHALRIRLSELRRPERIADNSPSPALSTVANELMRAEGTLELLTGLYRVIKPALLTAFQEHVQQINPLVDYPTGRVLRQIIQEEAEQIAFGQHMLATLIDEAATKQQHGAENWAEHLGHYLRLAGGVSGDGPTPTVVETPAPRADGTAWHPPIVSARDKRFTSSDPKEPCLAISTDLEPVRAGLEQMMWVRFHEMSPAEAISAIITQQHDMPWAFYRDLARHCWDEVRHACFGQAALQAEGFDVTSNPNWTGWVRMAQDIFTPMEAYTHLTIAIEQANMRYPPGKRQEYEFCRDVAKHPLMALYQDYDWADEVNHAQFGRTWVVEGIYKHDRRAAVAAGDETFRRRLTYFAQFQNQKQPNAQDEQLSPATSY